MRNVWITPHDMTLWGNIVGGLYLGECPGGDDRGATPGGNLRPN